MKTTSNKNETSFDAAIVGGGIAGAATAVNLAAAGWSVVFLHRRDGRDTIESLSPEASRLLNALSIQLGEPLLELTSWWGKERAVRREYVGARVVRRLAVVDKLRERAIEAGAIQFAFGGCLKLIRVGDGWDVGVVDSAGHDHRFRVMCMVDASGRASIAGRKAGASRQSVDELFSVTASLWAPGLVGVWTESVEGGWWNLCSTRERGSLSFFGARRAVESVRHRFDEEFAATRYLSELLRPAVGHVSIRPCGSSRLCPSAGKGWLAVGDAAASVQPLASSGIARALRDAAMAKEALEGRFRSYESFQQADFESYCASLKRQYAIERRWPRSSFWESAVNAAPSRSIGSV